MSHIRIFLILTAMLLVPVVYARGVYQDPAEFINQAFAGDPPQVQKLWISRELKGMATDILGHPPGVLRISYWGRGLKTAWVLEEIGKELPITAGFIINKDKVEAARVLIFRESRGWEIRHPFFTDQFKGIMLDQNNNLDQAIDGITGATLSVNALTRLARLALLFHRRVVNANDDTRLD